MSFSPVCRWVGWRHYIQYRPSRHHRSQPHTSPLASGTLARTRWCTGFIQGGETKQGTKQLDEVENTEKSRASEHKYVWVDKRMHQHAKKPAKLVALTTKFLIRRCKTRFFFYGRRRTRRDALLQVRRTSFRLSCRPGELNPALPSASLPPMKQGQTLCGGNFNYHLDALH